MGVYCMRIQDTETGTHTMKLRNALALAALLTWGAVQLLTMVGDAASIGLVR